jgi:hypothetical protein
LVSGKFSLFELLFLFLDVLCFFSLFLNLYKIYELFLVFQYAVNVLGYFFRACSFCEDFLLILKVLEVLLKALKLGFYLKSRFLMIHNVEFHQEIDANFLDTQQDILLDVD